VEMLVIRRIDDAHAATAKALDDAVVRDGFGQSWEDAADINPPRLN
jgi:hypothetical protein